MLLNLLAILVAPLAIRVRSVEVVGVWRNERSWDTLVQQIIPREVTQPRVVLNVLRTVKSETIQGLALDQTVYEVGSLNGPAWWNVSASDLHLPSKNMLADLASIPASVRPPAEHALVADDTHGEIVDSNSVRLAAHNFGSHVTWRARRIFLVLRIPHSSNTQVSDLQVAILVEDKVLRLDITM